jgi:glycosyltransferase involved in cell wall biosynthesis
MSTPSISVVIPTYNRARTVGKAIDSILSQTFGDVEIIVVDDGSTDDSTAVLASYCGRIRTIRQENQGVSAARNAGIRAANGKWIAFLDSDDQWHPTKLEKQLAALGEHGSKVCFTRCVDDQQKLIQDVDGLKPATSNGNLRYFDDALDAICRVQCHPQVQSMIASRELVLHAGMFDESLYAAEDTRLIYNLFFLSGFLYVDETLVTICARSPHSLTYDSDPEKARRRYSSYLRVQSEAYWRLIEMRPEKASAVRRRLGHFISRRAELVCAAGQPCLARQIARDGMGMAGDMRCFIRCLAIWLCPGLVRGRFRRKWHPANGDVAGSPVKTAGTAA